MAFPKLKELVAGPQCTYFETIKLGTYIFFRKIGTSALKQSDKNVRSDVVVVFLDKSATVLFSTIIDSIVRDSSDEERVNERK